MPKLWLFIVVFLLGCRSSSILGRHRGDHEKESKRVVSYSSHRVADDDDPMDCDCEVEEVMRSKNKAPSRRLPSSSRASLSSSESEENDSGGYEGDGESLTRRGARGCRRNTDDVGQRS